MSSNNTWPRLTLKTAGISLIDCDHRTPVAVENGYPYIAIPQLKNGHISLQGVRHISRENYLEWTKKLKPQANDVIVVRRCNSGDSAHVPPGFECAIGQNLIILRANGQKVLPEFLRWLINGPDWWEQVLKYINVGAVFDSLRCRDIPNFELTIPPIEHQREISTLLGGLDNRITLLRDTNTTLEAIAQALFKSWFVDFDPVRAKQEGREPEGMDADTAALFPDSFEESELGLIPKGWKMVPFGELLCHTTGGDWGSDIPDEKNDTRVAIIRGTDIPDLQTGSNNRVPFRYTSIKKLDTRRLEDGDIVLEISGGSKDQPTGRSLYLTPLLLAQFDCPVEPASFCRLLRPTRKDIGMILGLHLTYIYAQGKTWEYQNQSTGISNFQTVHFLKAEPVILPPDNIISVFVDAIHPMIARTHLSQIKQLATLRDTLLPRLISGQLRLPEAETLMDEVGS